MKAALVIGLAAAVFGWCAYAAIKSDLDTHAACSAVACEPHAEPVLVRTTRGAVCACLVLP